MALSALDDRSKRPDDGMLADRDQDDALIRAPYSHRQAQGFANVVLLRCGPAHQGKPG